MNRTLTTLLAATLLAVASPTFGYSYQREIFSPGGVYADSAWFSAGITYCDDNGTVAQQAASVDCNTGGLGGAFIDISDVNSTVFIQGTCTVTQTAAPDPATVGDFAFVCSTDRDDDGRYTNIDEDSTDQDGWDDDFAVGYGGPGQEVSVDFCFARDGASAGDDFDDIRVFMEAPEGGSLAVGTFHVEVVFEAITTGGCTRSSHSHADAEDTNPPPPPPPQPGTGNTGGWACTE
jgi:hypothetical protein